MNLEKISNQSLLSNIEILVKKEKEFTINILKHLVEIDRRKIFVELGFNSLYTYCRDRLNYSEQETTIRINAARLMKTNKVAEQKIEAKTISLTTAADLFSNIKKYNETHSEKLTSLQKDSLINAVSNKSSREAKQIIQEKLKLTPEIKTEIKLKKATIERMNKLKEKLNIHDIDLFLNALMQEKEDALIEAKQKSTSAPVEATSNLQARYVPVKLKRVLLKTAKYQCEFVNTNGQRCETRTFLEVEHMKPFGLGGNTTLSNLAILCSTHNKYTGINSFGIKKMNSYQRFKK